MDNKCVDKLKPGKMYYSKRPANSDKNGRVYFICMSLLSTKPDYWYRGVFFAKDGVRSTVTGPGGRWVEVKLSVDFISMLEEDLLASTLAFNPPTLYTIPETEPNTIDIEWDESVKKEIEDHRPQRADKGFSVNLNYEDVFDSLSQTADQVNHPSHYKGFSVEVIDMMYRVFGRERFMAYCEINAFKYRMRAGLKDDALQDIEKAEKYMWFKQNVENNLTPLGQQVD